jgi:hypothetical protein
MPRLTPPQVAAATKPLRTPAQLANDARLKSRRQRVAPVVIRKMTESQEQQVGQDGVREFNKDNELPHVGVDSPIDISGTKRKKGGPRDQKWLDAMAFANEYVTVMIHESTDKTAHPFPEVSVNGRTQRFVRGHEQKVRRYFVEKLARLKLTTYDNVKQKDVDGEDVYRYPTHTGLVYPFALVNPTARDTAWLKGILAEGG